MTPQSKSSWSESDRLKNPALKLYRVTEGSTIHINGFPCEATESTFVILNENNLGLIDPDQVLLIPITSSD